MGGGAEKNVRSGGVTESEIKFMSPCKLEFNFPKKSWT